MSTFLFGVSISLNIFLITIIIIYVKIKKNIYKHKKNLKNLNIKDCIENNDEFKDFMNDFDLLSLLGGVKNDN